MEFEQKSPCNRAFQVLLNKSSIIPAENASETEQNRENPKLEIMEDRCRLPIRTGFELDFPPLLLHGRIGPAVFLYPRDGTKAPNLRGPNVKN